jgi:hypothetical protein
MKIMRWSAAALALFVAAAWMPRSASAQDVSTSGVVYAQWLYQLKQDADSSHYNAFDVTRAYVNIRGKFKGGVSTRVTGDIYRDANGSYNYRLKYAYVGFTPKNSPVTFLFGQVQTPWLDWNEGMWGYRMQGTMALDRNHYLSSSDIGLVLDGTFQNHLFDFYAGVYNGEGYHAGEGDRHKDVMARASVRLLKSDDMSARGGLRLTAEGQLGAPTGGGRRNRAIGQLSYKSRLFTLATEIAATADSSTSSATPDVKGVVSSTFGVLNVPNSDVSLIGRVDIVNPNKDVSGDRKTNYIFGVAYRISPNLRILGDWDYTHYETPPADFTAAAASSSKALFQMEFTF